MESFEEVVGRLTANENTLALYSYGSVVYGTNDEKSDRDLIAVMEDGFETEAFGAVGVDVNAFGRTSFERAVAECEISALECLWLPKEFVHKEDWRCDFSLDLGKLRGAISAKASNSWVKAKKKFVVEADRNERMARKSAWHALRILDFGRQVAISGKIVDYESVNGFWPELSKCGSWDELDAGFRAEYNEKATAFRLVAPKSASMKP